MRPSLAAAAAALLLTSGCGYIAGTLAPLANIPGPPQDLAALQRGSTVIAHFTVPSLTTELAPIPGALTLDLRAGPPPDPWNQAEWESKAGRELPHDLVTIPPANRKAQETQVAEYQFSGAAWANQDVVLAARVIGSNGKPSNWTPLLTLHVLPPLPQPADVKATPMANGIRVTWSSPSGHFHVLRHGEGETSFAPLADTTAPEYLDTTAEFGKTYTYQVLAFAAANNRQEAQSNLSAEAKVSYKDTFPPAAPAGVRASPSPSSIELSWEANAEPDLAAYRVYRSVNGAAFEKLADVNEIPAYSDRAVEQGKTYRYAITALDKAGNESAPSAPVESSLQ